MTVKQSFFFGMLILIILVLTSIVYATSWNRTIFYDDMSGADNWTYGNGAVSSRTGGWLSVNDTVGTSGYSIINITNFYNASNPLVVEYEIKYDSFTGSYGGVGIGISTFPAIAGYIQFLRPASTYIYCYDGAGGAESDYAINTGVLYHFVLIWNPISQLYNLTINGTTPAACLNKHNLTIASPGTYSLILGGGSSSATWNAWIDYVNVSQIEDLLPDLSCSYGDSLTKISYRLETGGSFPQKMNVTGQTSSVPILNCSNSGGSGSLQMKVNATYGSGTGFTNFYTNTTAQVGSAWATTFPYNNFNNIGGKYSYLEHNITYIASSAAAGSALKVYWDSTSSSAGNENVYLEWQTSDYSLKYDPGYDRTISGISAGAHTINLKINYTADTFVMCVDGASCQAARSYTDNGNGYIGFTWGASGPAVNITKYTVDGYFLVQDICSSNSTAFNYTLSTSYQTINTLGEGTSTGIWCMRNYTQLPAAKKSLMYSIQLI